MRSARIVFAWFVMVIIGGLSWAQVHVVEKGDTLWDIAKSYVGNPFEWPNIWRKNPQIEDPHWIYPGDEVSLSQVQATSRNYSENASNPNLSYQSTEISDQPRSIPMSRSQYKQLGFEEKIEGLQKA